MFEDERRGERTMAKRRQSDSVEMMVVAWERVLVKAGWPRLY
jgi:hypothetical protein